jgi:hypothetical protein
LALLDELREQRSQPILAATATIQEQVTRIIALLPSQEREMLRALAQIATAARNIEAVVTKWVPKSEEEDAN